MRMVIAATVVVLGLVGSAQAQRPPIDIGRDFFGKTTNDYIDERFKKEADRNAAAASWNALGKPSPTATAPRTFSEPRRSPFDPYGDSAPTSHAPRYYPAPYESAAKRTSPSPNNGLMIGIGIGIALAVAFYLGKRSEKKTGTAGRAGDSSGSVLAGPSVAHHQKKPVVDLLQADLDSPQPCVARPTVAESPALLHAQPGSDSPAYLLVMAGVLVCLLALAVIVGTGGDRTPQAAIIEPLAKEVEEVQASPIFVPVSDVQATPVSPVAEVRRPVARSPAPESRPASTASPVVSNAFQGRRVLGIIESPITFPNGRSGMMISQIYRGSPAQKARLRVGDVIWSVNGIPTQQPGDLAQIIAEHTPGNTLHIQFYSATDDAEESVVAVLQ